MKLFKKAGIDTRAIVEFCLEKCIDNNYKDYYEFRDKAEEDCNDLLIALAARENYDHFIELFPLSIFFSGMRFGAKYPREDFIAAYIVALHECDSLKSRADQLISEAWVSHWISFPETRPRVDATGEPIILHPLSALGNSGCDSRYNLSDYQ